MKICPKCGGVVSGLEVLFHECPPSTENGNPKDYNLHWFLKNITYVTTPIWLVTLFIPKFLLDQLGIVLGLTVLISPPLLIWFCWNMWLKGKYLSAFLISVVIILILILPIRLIYFVAAY